MLVISRNPNQKLRIGDDIVIVVIQSQDGKARLGIEAPKDMKVWREEVYQRIKAEEA